MLRRVVYISQACGAFSDTQLQLLASRASNRNATVGITGLLVYGAGWFMQVVEGPATSIELVLSRIYRDDRHRDVEIVLDDQTRDRMFSSWSMGVHNLDTQDDGALDRVMSIVGRIRKTRTGSRNSRTATMLLLREFQKFPVRTERAAG